MDNVLIIDDSKFSRKTIKDYLVKLNYNVVGEAVDGLDGIEKFKELNPDLIITDLEMPKIDGLEMIKHIREGDTDIRIVVVSSVVNSQIIHEAIKMGASVVKKPINEHRLQNAIQLLSRG